MAGRTDVVRITAGTARGTGFLVAADRVLTALHVVGVASGGAVVAHGPLRIEGADGTVCAELDVVAVDATHDWVCLRVEGFEALARPRIRAPQPGDAAWTAYGFPDDAEKTGKAAGGAIRSLDADVRIGGMRQRAIQVFSDEFAAGGAPGGFSGAPVLVGDEVIALFVLAEERAASGTMYALPVTPILARLAAPSGPRPLVLVYAELALPGRFAAGLLATDRPDELAATVDGWPAWLATSRLRTDKERDRIRGAKLAALLAEPVLRDELVQQRLARTSFELFVYHAADAAAPVRAEALFERLRTKRPAVARIDAREDLAADVAAACAKIRAADKRTVAPPPIAKPRRALADLADLALGIVAHRLATPDDAAAVAEFEAMRMHLRLALDVVTRERHRLEQNPL